MARTRLDLPLASISLLAAIACGDRVTTSSGGTGGHDEATAGAAAQGGEGGAASETTSTGGSPICAGAACGDPCTVCNDVECLQGLCDVDGSCAPFDAVSCPSGAGGGAGGGAPACPSPAEVSIGVPCEQEGQVCPSESSCSGVLDCADGSWALFQPC